MAKNLSSKGNYACWAGEESSAPQKANACHFISNVFLFLIHWQFYSLMRFYCFYICYWFERYMLTIILISASLNFSLFQQQWLSNASGNCHPEVSLLLVLQNYLTQGSKCVPTSSIREWRPTQKQQLISNLQIYPHGTNMTADNTAGWHTGAILEILQQQFRRVYLQLLQRATRLIQCGQAFGQKDVSIFRSILQREKTISRCAKQKQRLAYHVAKLDMQSSCLVFPQRLRNGSYQTPKKWLLSNA